MPQTNLRQGPFLAWAGFEAVCRDFHITTTPIPPAMGSPNSRHPQPSHDHAHHEPDRGAPLGHQPPSKAKPGASSSKMTRQPDCPASRLSPAETPSGGVLSRVQACIAFVSACTERFMVASFPNGGKSDGVFSGDNARRDKASRGSSAEDGCAEGDAPHWRVSCFFKHARSTKKKPHAKGISLHCCFVLCISWLMVFAECVSYNAGELRGVFLSSLPTVLLSSSQIRSQDMERLVLSGLAELGGSSAPGLSFRLFVDALARCGLLAFSSKHLDGTKATGFGGAIGITRSPSDHISAAERVQAMLITKMRLLDSQYVDARIQQLVRSPSTNHEGETSEESNRVGGIMPRTASGHASGAGTGRGGRKTKTGGHAARGGNSTGRPRGGSTSRKVATHPKPATTIVLAPLQTTPRGRETKAS